MLRVDWPQINYIQAIASATVIILMSTALVNWRAYAQNMVPPPVAARDANASQASCTTLTEKVVVVGVIGIGETWQVALRDYEHGKTCFLHENETAFGYRVKRITVNGAVLEGAGKEFELRLGEYISVLGSPAAHQWPPVSGSHASFPIPDLVRMENTERQQWVEQWRHALSALKPEEQEVAREQMREYWRQQWEGELMDFVLTLEPEEQVRIRTEIRRYWRE